MKRPLITTLLLIAFALTSMAESRHFISDEAYRTRVEKTFKQKMHLIGNTFFNKMLKCSTEESEALKFLYAYMPIADVTDYPTTFYLQNVRSSLLTREEMPWGKDVPELLFRHFVLPIRVNNENLDSSRVVFYKELKQRVKGKSMYDAILEVNHWCHEHVTYQPSDGRTLSPLACVRNAIGRCGEESTFTVAALRAIGIPARQVYTPRWAHTDDNHAWVEAWADGKWHFLGACEPEPVLDLGWFNAPASRAMLVHTNAFGDYEGTEEVLLRTSNYTEINVIDNYTQTAKIDFNIIDHNGKPAANARVDFKIYNYAEYCTVDTKFADAKGHTFLTAGKGDMIVWASLNGRYGFCKASFGKDQSIDIHLSRTAEDDAKEQIFAIDSLDIVPPPEHSNIPELSKEIIAANKLRFAQEDSIRKAYENTFITQNEAYHFSERFAPFLIKARGNWLTIKNFIIEHNDNEQRTFDILSSLSDKDLRDMQTNILNDNFNASSNQLCPRVENEMIITPFKQQIEASELGLKANKFRKNPSLLVNWIKKNIRINPDKKAQHIAQTPIGVLNSRITDERSRDILFVDMARSLNITAQKDIVTGKVQYKTDNGSNWIDVDFDAKQQKATPKGTLVLNYVPTPTLDDPKYYSHFTITRIENGLTNLLNFEEGQVDMGGGTSWSNTFMNGTKLDEGTYMLVTGSRMADGSVLATSQIFNIKADETTSLNLNLRTSSDKVGVIGNFDSESKFVRDDKEVSILSQTGRGYFTVGIIGVGEEPTNHALRDIAKAKKAINEWNRPMILLFEDEATASKFNISDFGSMPDNIIFGIDKDGAILKQIKAQMKLATSQLPVFIIADTFNRVVFCKQGYTIGLGEQLEKVIKKL